MLRTSPRTWVAGTAALLAVVVAAAWMLVISPARAEAAQARASAAGAEASNDAVRQRTAELHRQFSALPEQQAELSRLQAAMPDGADLAPLLRELQAGADAAGVTLMSVTPGTAAVPTATGAAGAATTGRVTLDLPVGVQVVGSFARSELFLRSLQTELSRAFLVRDLHVVAEAPAPASKGRPATVNGDVTMTLAGSVFVVRDAADVNRAAVAGTAAAPAHPAAPAASTGPASAAGGTETP